MTSFEEIYKECQTEEEERRIEESWKDTYEKCEKITNHDKYFKVSELASRLPQPYGDDADLIKRIKTMANLTVRIEVLQQQDKKIIFGTGFVQKVRRERGDKCPDERCSQKGMAHSWAVVTVTTVYHVIAKKTKTSIFEEFADRVEVKLFTGQNDGQDENCDKILKGFKLVDSDKEINNFDWCAIECLTHRDVVIDELEKTLKTYEDLQKKNYAEYRDKYTRLIVIIGYPHGGPKRASFCEPRPEDVKRNILKEVRETQEWCCYYYTAATCPGSSGSPVFILGQPLCGFGYWFGHPHNHSAWKNEDKKAISSIGVDHINNVSYINQTGQ